MLFHVLGISHRFVREQAPVPVDVLIRFGQRARLVAQPLARSELQEPSDIEVKH
jgi:hypothetical protein